MLVDINNVVERQQSVRIDPPDSDAIGPNVAGCCHLKSRMFVFFDRFVEIDLRRKPSKRHESTVLELVNSHVVAEFPRQSKVADFQAKIGGQP